MKEYRQILEMIISDLEVFLESWKPMDPENLTKEESSLVISHENLRKMYDSMCKELTDRK
jgi:hypothetical protein